MMMIDTSTVPSGEYSAQLQGLVGNTANLRPLTIGAGGMAEDEAGDLVYPYNADALDAASLPPPAAAESSILSPLMLPQWATPLRSYVDLGFATHNHTRILSLGVGAATLHSSFLQSYPQLIVDSLDFSEDIARSAMEDFHMHRSVCRFLKMLPLGSSDNSDAGAEHRYEFVPLKWQSSTSAMEKLLSDDFTADEVADGRQCRSTFIIADAWAYIREMSRGALLLTAKQLENGPETHRVRVRKAHHYDIVVQDLFSSSSSSSWSGSDTEDGNLDIASMADLIAALKGLLAPNGGVAIFHLWQDAQFQRYQELIAKIFGADQLVLLKSKSNDNVIIAAMNRFTSTRVSAPAGAPQRQQLHPCHDSIGFASSVVEFAARIGFTGQLKFSHQYALDCDFYAREVGLR